LQNFGVITRVTTTGSIDRKFGKNAVADVPFQAIKSIAALPDGRIAVVGEINATDNGEDADPRVTTTHEGIVMLKDDGQLDSTFGKNGVIHTDDTVSVYGVRDEESSSIDNCQLIPMSRGSFLYLRRDHDSGNTYQNSFGDGIEFDHTLVHADLYRRDGSLDPSFQFDRTHLLGGSGDEISGDLLQGAASLCHDTTILFVKTDDQGYEQSETNDHLFMLKLAHDGTLTRTSIATQLFAYIAHYQGDGAIVVNGLLGQLIRYRPGKAQDETFATDPRVTKRYGQLIALTNTNDGQVLALYQREFDGPSGRTTSSFIAKLQSSDAPAGVFSGAGIRTDRTSYTFKITWADDRKVDASSLGSSDVLVIAPDGSELRARRLSIDPTIDSGVIDATYRAIGPGGVWDPADNGTYFIRVRSNHVFDTEGHAARGRVVGRFEVRITAHV
jgi:hypothetical protein